MTEEKQKKDEQKIEDIQSESSDKKDIPLKSNRSLLWAIFSVLTVLVILLVAMTVLFVNGNRTQKEMIKEAQMKKEQLEKEVMENKKEVKQKESVSDAATVSNTTTTVTQNKVPATANPSVQSAQKPTPKRCKAKKFDDKKYDDGESYTTLDGCETCTCDDGDWDCEIKPSCIILPTDCSYNNHVYHDKDTRMAQCDQTCTCDKGAWKCELPADSGCCKDIGGKIHHDRDSYDASDGCNTCTCNDGRITCTMMLCIDPIFP